jgi:hypothetical protein
MTKEELVAQIKKNPISFGCGAASVLLIAALYFRSGEIPAAEAELAQKTAEAERYALNIKNADKLKDQLDALIAANKTIESRMVHVRDQGLNTQYFYKLMSDAGVNRVDFRQGTTTASLPKGSKAAFIPVAFGVSVQGNLNQILDFLRMLENGTHYCRVLTAMCGVSGTNRSAPLTLALNLELLGLP